MADRAFTDFDDAQEASQQLWRAAGKRPLAATRSEHGGALAATICRSNFGFFGRLAGLSFAVAESATPRPSAPDSNASMALNTSPSPSPSAPASRACGFKQVDY
jgi:hypothetical protein